MVQVYSSKELGVTEMKKIFMGAYWWGSTITESAIPTRLHYSRRI